MDSILEMVCFFLHWRFVLSVISSIVVALVLSNSFVGFSADYCITFVLCGTAFGLIWQGRAEVGVGLVDPVPETRVSHPVAFMGFAFIGFFWGGVASFVLRSEILAALFLVCAVISIGVWYRWGLKRAVSLGYLAFSAVSLLLGYGSIVILKFANS